MNASSAAKGAQKDWKDAEEKHHFLFWMLIHHGTEIRKHTKAPIMYGNSKKRYIVLFLDSVNNLECSEHAHNCEHENNDD